ncbi:hypothetical protein RRG08_027133 [Elysia crispata]|uniref:Uncharacterized protein n=1 Tax=Elysia crispata TaxID=231223 RepID=A0AAE1D581_9GAST|nr:hypothetical protein RRG08_027133 [Elysia crispata]
MWSHPSTPVFSVSSLYLVRDIFASITRLTEEPFVGPLALHRYMSLDKACNQTYTSSCRFHNNISRIGEPYMERRGSSCRMFSVISAISRWAGAAI